MPSAGMILLVLLSTLFSGCYSSTPIRKSTIGLDSDEKSAAMVSAPPLARVGYSVQLGAFSDPENALRLEERLRLQGLDAYHFRHESGLYKVRFGNYSTHSKAGEDATKLRETGQIGEFFIVSPEKHASSGIRRGLVETATRFLGVPYSWGGDSAVEGFDCSGLTMAVYRLNGLNLPRQSTRQFRAGRPVDRRDLDKGDLVFFAMNGGRAVSHVGVYVGDGGFIHAPRPGKTVYIANLDSDNFKQRYVGARSYL